MNFLSQGKWKSLLMPGGAVVLGAALLLHGRLVQIPASTVTFYYYAVFVVGPLLAWRFHSSRALFTLLVLLLAERALEFFAGSKLPHLGPGRVAFDWIALLVPLNFLILSSLKERGLTLPSLVSPLLLMFVQSVFVAVMCRPGAAEGSNFLGHVVLNQRLFAWTKIPQLALLTFVCAGATLFIRALRLRSPVEKGFFWSLLATFLALQFGGTGRVPTAYMATAGLALVAALIESSYFMAYHDELTGLPGRRAFNEAVLGLEDRYALAILDIDHFKRFNDTYGHDTGDQVLRMVASRLARVTGGGKAFRCGGEEFAIVFPDKSTKEIIDDLEALRAAIENSSFRMRGLDRRNQPRQTDRRKTVNQRRKISRSQRSTPSSREIRELSVTVSIGVAEAGTRNRNVEQVIEAADQALYRAKAAGRNRVEVASAPRARTSRSVKQSA